MSADVFGSKKVLSGAIRGASVAMTIGTAGTGANGNTALAGAMVQAVQLQYSRHITRVFELGSENMYYNIGNSEGQGSISSIVGPASQVSNALAVLGDPCQAPANVVGFSGANSVCGGSAAGDASTIAVTAKGALLQSTSIQLNAQDFLMQSGGQFLFASLVM